MFNIKNIEEYNLLSEATLSKNTNLTKEISNELDIAISDFLKASQKLDEMKRKIFYVSETTIEECKFSDIDMEMLHGALGVATESAEILQAIQSKNLDLVNLNEEIGDIMWYFAIFFRKSKANFYKILSNNLNKLYKRFGSKFDEFLSKNRNIEDERKELEK